MRAVFVALHILIQHLTIIVFRAVNFQRERETT